MVTTSGASFLGTRSLYGGGDPLLTVPLCDHGGWPDLTHPVPSSQGLSSAEGLHITEPGSKGETLTAQLKIATNTLSLDATPGRAKLRDRAIGVRPLLLLLLRA